MVVRTLKVSVPNLPIPVAERSKVRLCGRSLAAVAGSNPAGGMDVCLLCACCCTARTIRTKEYR